MMTDGKAGNLGSTDDPAIDRARMSRYERALRIQRPGDTFLLDAVVDDLIDRLGAVQREFGTAIALFGSTARLADRMRELPNIGSVLRVEEPVHDGKADRICTPDALGLDPLSADLIVAPSGLHHASDLPGVFRQLASALRPDGLLLSTLPAPDTLRELREAMIEAESALCGGAAQRVDAFTDIRSAGGLLNHAGFALPVIDREALTVRYDSASALIADLRRFGCTASPSGKPRLPKGIASALDRTYAARFADEDGRVRATFAFASMSGWKPHESQQKPARRGSGTVSLADVLGSGSDDRN